MENIYTSDSNTILGVQSKDFLEDYYKFLDSYLIEYRDKLGLNKNYTFGVEIEYDEYPEARFEKIVSRDYKNTFDSQTEMDLYEGGEVSSKIFTDRKSSWVALKNILAELKAVKAKETERCGGHVHVGAHPLGSNTNLWKKFIYLYIVYEPIIYRFACGDYLNLRNTIYAKAYPCQIELASKLKEFETSRDITSLAKLLKQDDRYRGLNTSNIRFQYSDDIKNGNTIEFRMANGTLSPIVWQNLVNCYLNLVDTAKNKDVDLEYLKYRIEDIANKYNYLGFTKINEKDALEFVDTIFNKNIDKTNFLRLYFKDRREVDSPELVKSNILHR